MQEEFTALRNIVQNIDTKIVSLLSERTTIIQRVKYLKKTHDIPIFSPEYEESLLLKQKKKYHAIWKEIFSLSKREQGFVCYVFLQPYLLLAKYCLGCSTNVQCIDVCLDTPRAIVTHPSGTVWLRNSMVPADISIWTICFFDTCDPESIESVECSSYRQCYRTCIFRICSGSVVQQYACYVLYPVSSTVTFDIEL